MHHRSYISHIYHVSHISSSGHTALFPLIQSYPLFQIYHNLFRDAWFVTKIRYSLGKALQKSGTGTTVVGSPTRSGIGRARPLNSLRLQPTEATMRQELTIPNSAGSVRRTVSVPSTNVRYQQLRSPVHCFTLPACE